MKLKAVPENALEWWALHFNLVPMPLLHGQMFPVISKAVLVAAEKGIFGAVGNSKETAEEIAEKCQLSPAPTLQLLQLLVSLGYLTSKNRYYMLTPMTRKWLLAGSPSDLSALLVYNNRVVWKWMEHLETYLQTGQGIDYHKQFGPEEWALYQRAMLAMARTEVSEFARKCPIPTGATRMLDIGGAHGLHVKALKEKHKSLAADILDLPGAIAIHQEEIDTGFNRIEGDILLADLGKERYDFVLMSNLAHHFSEADNRMIAGKVASALKPGGVYVINEFVQPESKDTKDGLIGTSSNLFFGLTSTSGTWKISETREWQAAAGLVPLKPVGYMGIPGRYQIGAVKGR